MCATLRRYWGTRSRSASAEVSGVGFDRLVCDIGTALVYVLAYLGRKISRHVTCKNAQSKLDRQFAAGPSESNLDSKPTRASIPHFEDRSTQDESQTVIATHNDSHLLLIYNFFQSVRLFRKIPPVYWYTCICHS